MERKKFYPLSIEYGKYWEPTDTEEARQMILTGSTPEQFEKAGRYDAQFISKYLPKNSVVLDFGCGIGRIIKYLPSCRMVFAVDANLKMLNLARERLKDRNDVFFVLSDGTRFPIQIPHIDLCYSYWTFQHMDKADAKYVMRRISRSLRLGGKVVYTFVELKKPGEMGVETRSWTQNEVKEVLENTGIIVIDSKTGPGIYKEMKCFVVVGRKNWFTRPWVAKI